MTAAAPDSRSIGQQQDRHQHEERCQALRALLMTPLMTPAHAEFAAVRRHADELRAWFARETGWALHIERDCARLYKRPADLGDASRGLPGYDRRRYVLLCLACAVLERADPQITLRMLGERLLVLAAEPSLLARDFSFALQAQHERRELVAVCRSLLELGVLQRVAGDEEGFVRSGDNTADALYDVQRRVLAGVLAAVRGPSTWVPEEAPVTLEERMVALVAEHVADSDDGRRTALRHHLSRRLLDDPVVYVDALDALDTDLRSIPTRLARPSASKSASVFRPRSMQRSAASPKTRPSRRCTTHGSRTACLARTATPRFGGPSGRTCCRHSATNPSAQSRSTTSAACCGPWSRGV